MDNNAVQKLIDNDDDLKTLLEAHLGKSEKVNLFYNIIKNKVVDGRVKKRTFSWWGFFGGALYFMYRKMYLYTLIIFGAALIPEMFNIQINSIGIAIAIACGITAIPSYVDKFFKDAVAAGYGRKNIEEVKKEMASLGGYNIWAIVLFVLITCLGVFAAFYEKGLY